eukprot:1730815-Rhodomonas_salina.4
MALLDVTIHNTTSLASGTKSHTCTSRKQQEGRFWMLLLNNTAAIGPLLQQWSVFRKKKKPQNNSPEHSEANSSSTEPGIDSCPPSSVLTEIAREKN